MFKAFLVKYAEIGIKGKNRYLFEDALMRQMRFALQEVDGTFKVHKSSGRVYVECEGDYDYEETVDALKRVFGIVGICPVVHVPDEGFEELKKEKIFVRHFNGERIKDYLRISIGTDQQMDCLLQAIDRIMA